jgi:hypothetical protein
MAKQPEILREEAPKKGRLKLHDLPARQPPKGGASKSHGSAPKSKSPVPKSLEEFLKRDSLRIN